MSFVVNPLMRLLDAASEWHRRKHFRASFTGFKAKYNGETFHFVWDGPIGQIMDERNPRRMTLAFQDWLFNKLRGQNPRKEPFLALPADARGDYVFETD